jgi:hypothetical protein
MLIGGRSEKDAVVLVVENGGGVAKVALKMWLEFGRIWQSPVSHL